jgi:hypothetical protein
MERKEFSTKKISKDLIFIFIGARFRQAPIGFFMTIFIYSMMPRRQNPAESQLLTLYTGELPAKL